MADGVAAPPGSTLRGRRDECAVLDGLLAGARAGRSGALVLRGDAGVGKTALLEYMVASASDLGVVRAAGVESEMELAFAALHQLCVPVLDRLERLPGPQRDALRVTFGLSEGAVPDRFLVGLAVLGLLAEAAEERALVCIVDDAQWLDTASARALAFVARRLFAESVVLLFAARQPTDELIGLEELRVAGLSEADARELLWTAVPGRLDEQVREQLLGEARGNPLALLELTRGVSAAQLAGGFGLPGALSLEGRIEQSFLARVDALPDDSRRLLLVAAADPTGDPALVWRAADSLSIGAAASGPAESAGLLEVGARMRFRHPLVRSVVYRAASREQRRQAHRALAEATDATVDPDRRAWHLAEAATGPDEEVAAELERAAGRAQARGGLTAAAAFLERATTLTVDPSHRSERALAAAQTKVQAGALDAVAGLLATAQAGPLTELQQARVDLVRGQLAFATSPGKDAAPLLLIAAKRLEPLAPDLSRATYLRAMWAAAFAGRFALAGGSVLDVLSAASGSPPHAPTPADSFLDGLAASFSEGYAAGVPILRRALNEFGDNMPVDQELRVLPLVRLVAAHLWDDDQLDLISDRWARLCRRTDALSELPIALSLRAMTVVFHGDLTGAASLVEEARAATEATGINATPYGAMCLAAVRGDEAEAVALTEASVRDASLRGEGSSVSAAEWANAILHNGLGHYEQGLAGARRVSEDRSEPVLPNRALAEFIEAAVRTGMGEAATGAARRLREVARAAGTNWALGVEARSRALLSRGEAAENLYREATDRLGRTHMRVELARAHLLYGEWLRRANRRVDAREQLRTADTMFTEIGAGAFAERTKRELLATGQRVRKRTVETREDLTTQEAQVARLAREGVSNAEIAERLFISRSTVEYHLHKVFTKLGISSRHQLERALPPEAIAGARP